MELSPAEEKLISTLREIDRRNPAGIDGFSEAKYLESLQRMLTGAPDEAGRRYELFIKQSKGQLVDLREAQRSKSPGDDPRART